MTIRAFLYSRTGLFAPGQTRFHSQRDSWTISLVFCPLVLSARSVFLAFVLRAVHAACLAAAKPLVISLLFSSEPFFARFTRSRIAARLALGTGFRMVLFTA